MRVIKKAKTKNITCRACKSILKPRPKNIEFTANNKLRIICPICGEWTVGDYEKFFITENNEEKGE